MHTRTRTIPPTSRATQVSGDSFTIRIINTAARVAYSGACVDEGLGNYTCGVTPNFYGHYAMAITDDRNDLHVAGSPYEIFIDYGPPSGASTAEGAGISVAVAGLPARFTVQVRDAYSNKRLEGGPGDAVLASLTSNSTAGVIAAACVHRSSGLYDCEYTARAAGPQVLTVTVAGEDIVGSPFAVQVHDGAQQGTFTTAAGAGLAGSTAGEIAEFEVTVRDLCVCKAPS
jgi:hypothetical protein